MSEYRPAQEFCVAYEASAYGMVVGASRAYARALAAHQDAALAGDPDALQAIQETRVLFTIAAPKLAQPTRDKQMPLVLLLKEHV
ncbi:hypothetical protein [Streptomyces sp. NBC_01451]|uniref:hypothetical protein n=1 Tax=Streptomyces sp. NBC_01451 TaxID=2903872 RepID=UPI002E36D4F0|nr:hypothetical protein [Streptomyces sp. NBC_01451]